MNKKSVIFVFMAWLAAAAISPLCAQNSGFQIGQSQPAPPAQIQNAQATSSSILLIAPIGSPIQPTGNPVLPLSGTIPHQQTTAASDRNGAITILPAGGTVFVPAGTLVMETGAGMEPGAFLSAPLSPAVPSADRRTDRATEANDRSNDRSNRAAAHQASESDITRLALGTSRDKVIAKYGNPIAFIMNMNGETLYFKGGAVVFIKDGVVAVPAVSEGPTRR
jgi:hypothetical protein